MLISAFAVFSYAVDDKGSTQSPVIDGKVDAGEYISERVYDNTDPNTGLPTSGNHVNFAAGCVPADGVSIIEYASEDDDNKYIAFVINQDFSSSYMAMTGRREAAATVKEMLNVTMIDFDFEDGEDETEGVVSGSAGLDGSSTDTDGTEMRAYRASEFDSIAKRNKNGDVFENITIEMKFSKKAIQDVCGVDSVEFIAYRFLYSPTAGGGNKELCSRPLYVSKATSGFATFEELADCYVDDEEFDFYNDGGRGGWKMLRFICFYEEPEVKAWYGPEGTVSSTGVQRAAVLDYTNFGRCGATSTYVTVKENEPPTVDGVVRCGDIPSCSPVFPPPCLRCRLPPA